MAAVKEPFNVQQGSSLKLKWRYSLDRKLNGKAGRKKLSKFQEHCEN